MKLMIKMLVGFFGALTLGLSSLTTGVALGCGIVLAVTLAIV